MADKVCGMCAFGAAGEEQSRPVTSCGMCDGSTVTSCGMFDETVSKSHFAFGVVVLFFFSVFFSLISFLS